MIQASICTIGDEILIGQVVDTNSSHLATALQEEGIRVTRMLSFGDDRTEILSNLEAELSCNEIVITTGGLGPTKDDITKSVLAELSGSTGFIVNEPQLQIIHRILHSRGLDVLEINRLQASVPDRCEVIPNKLGTAPVMVFRFPAERFGHPATLYALPGVPFEAVGAIPDLIEDLRVHQKLDSITHRSLMVYGIAESALSEKIASWEDSLPENIHLAYLPNPLTGIKLRLSCYGGSRETAQEQIDNEVARLRPLLGTLLYSEQEDTLEATIGRLLKGRGKTLAVAESCTGGEISHLVTSVPGSSAYYLGSVTSYAVSVKEAVLGVPTETVDQYGVVSSEVAAAMAEGVKKALGSDYGLATTGLAGPAGDGVNPVGTVWMAVSGPQGTRTLKRCYSNDRKRNIQRFAATALDFLRLSLLEDFF